MSLDERRIRESLLAGAEAASGEGCPDRESFWRAVRGELDAEPTRELLEHVKDCPACFRDWSLAREMAESAKTAPTATAGRPRNTWWLVAGAAAALLLVVWVGPRLLREEATGSRPVVRDLSASRIESRTSPDAPLSRNAFRLEWRPLQDAALYTVELVDPSFEPIHRVEGLTEPHVTVPAELLGPVEPGTVLFWRVEAVLTQGGTVESATFRVLVGE